MKKDSVADMDAISNKNKASWRYSTPVFNLTDPKSVLQQKLFFMQIMQRRLVSKFTL